MPPRNAVVTEQCLQKIKAVALHAETSLNQKSPLKNPSFVDKQMSNCWASFAVLALKRKDEKAKNLFLHRPSQQKGLWTAVGKTANPYVCKSNFSQCMADGGEGRRACLPNWLETAKVSLSLLSTVAKCIIKHTSPFTKKTFSVSCVFAACIGVIST